MVKLNENDLNEIKHLTRRENAIAKLRKKLDKEDVSGESKEG